MSGPAVLDAIDAKLLMLLQEDASLPVGELARRVGLSSSPCWRRIRRLEETGVIRRRVTLLDRGRLGLDLEVFAAIRLSAPSAATFDAFEAAVAGWPQVIQCAAVSGAADYMLRILVPDMAALDRFVRDVLLATGLVSGLDTQVVVRAVKITSSVPLPSERAPPLPDGA